MLYEVITINRRTEGLVQPGLLGAGYQIDDFYADRNRFNVITSYSIHYTKLYEQGLQPPRPDREPRSRVHADSAHAAAAQRAGRATRRLSDRSRPTSRRSRRRRSRARAAARALRDRRPRCRRVVGLV